MTPSPRSWPHRVLLLPSALRSKGCRTGTKGTSQGSQQALSDENLGLHCSDDLGVSGPSQDTRCIGGVTLQGFGAGQAHISRSNGVSTKVKLWIGLKFFLQSIGSKIARISTIRNEC